MTVHRAKLRVVGHSSGTNMFVIQYAITTIGQAMSILGYPNIVSCYLVRLSDHQKRDVVAKRIAADVPGIDVFSQAEFMENNLRKMRAGFLPILLIVSLISAIVLATILTAILVMNIAESRKDFAVAMVLGSPPSFLPKLITGQAVLLSLSGGIISLALIFPVTALLEEVFPELSTAVDALQMLAVIFLEIVIALVLGPSGSGKSTLLSPTAGLTQPTSGEVTVFDTKPSQLSPAKLQLFRANGIGFTFQNFMLPEWLTVEENVALVAEFAGKNSGAPSARATLERVGISHLAGRHPSNPSQGEKQRAAIARACVNNPHLLLADEPTASLESIQGFEIIKILHLIAKDESRCVIAASHDLRLIDYADDIVRLEDGTLRKDLCSKSPSGDLVPGSTFAF